MPAESALPAHRVLQPVRPSGGEFTAAWGNNDGNQIDVSLANLICEAHVFLSVPEANISYDLTLEDLLGPSFPKLAEVFLMAQLPLPWWMPREWLKGVALRPAWVPDLDHESFGYYSSLHYQILGGLVFASVRPDCVFHPHLRCRMEYHCGRLLAFEVFQGRLGSTRVFDFMAGCGIKFGRNAKESWVQSRLEKRSKTEISLFAAQVHTVWGEKCRVCRWFNAEANEDCFYLVPVACNNQDARKVCTNCYAAAGCGTVCNMFHGVTHQHAKQLIFYCFAVLRGSRNGKPWRQRTEAGEDLGFVDQLLGDAGYKCPRNQHYHRNPNQRLQMFQLPRFFPKFVNDAKKQQNPGVEWVGLFPGKMEYFHPDDVRAWRTILLSQRCAYTAVERLFLSSKKMSIVEHRISMTR